MRKIFFFVTPLIFLTKTSPVAATFGFFTNILTALTSFDDDDHPVAKPNYQVSYDYPDPGYSGTHPTYIPYPMSYKSSYSSYPISYKSPNYMFGQRYPGPFSSGRYGQGFGHGIGPIPYNPFINPYFYHYPYPYAPFMPSKGYPPYNIYKQSPFKCKFSSFYGSGPPIVRYKYK